MRSLALLFFLTTTSLAATLPIDLTEAQGVAASADGRSIAWASTHDGAAALVAVTDRNGAKQTTTWSVEEVQAQLEDGAVSALEWSGDGRFLAVEVANNLNASVVLLFDADKGKELRPLVVEGSANLTQPHWPPSGHVLYLLSADSEDDGAPVAGGIIRYDIETRRSTRLLPQLMVGAYNVAAGAITALGTDVDSPDDVAVDRIVRLDLRTGKSETVISRRTIERSSGDKALQL